MDKKVRRDHKEQKECKEIKGKRVIVVYQDQGVTAVYLEHKDQPEYREIM